MGEKHQPADCGNLESGKETLSVALKQQDWAAEKIGVMAKQSVTIPATPHMVIAERVAT